MSKELEALERTRAGIKRRSEVLAGEVRFHMERAEAKREANREVNGCLVEVEIAIAELKKEATK